MKYVGYDSDRNKYYVCIKNKCRYPSRNEAIDKALSILLAEYDENIVLDNTFVKKKVYHGRDESFIGYTEKFSGGTYFDINHILCYIGYSKNKFRDKFSDFKDRFTWVIPCENKFGGYIVRGLIDYDTTRKILCVSNKNRSVVLAKILGMDILSLKIERKENGTINDIISVFRLEKYKEQYVVGKYLVDLYFFEYKLVIECDEHNHSNRDADYERDREMYIVKKLGCTFLRFNPDSNNFSIMDVISNIHYEIMKSGKKNNK